MTVKRRQYLAATALGLSASFAGCLSNPTQILSDQPDSDQTITPSAGSSNSTGSECGPADQPLSALLTDESGECAGEGGAPSLVVQNERDEQVEVAVDLDGGGGFSETYTLDPSERVVQDGAFETTDGISGTVTIGDTEWSVKWPGRSCYRYGIALTSERPKIGWVKPIGGINDTQHACYPGDETSIHVRSKGQARTVMVTVTNVCDDTTTTHTLNIDAGKEKGIADALVSGGMYDVTVEIEGGGSKTYEYHNQCWTLNADIQADGSISFHGSPVY